MKNHLFWVIIAVIIAGGGWGLWREVTKPLPGQAVADMGARHVTDISGIEYNSNPPTSGPHFGIWAKKGVYDRAISDGYLTHSLEHGYVVISYNCDKEVPKVSKVSKVYAHETGDVHEEPATESANATASASSGSATPSAQPLTHMNYAVQGNMSWFTPENPPEKEVELSEAFNSQECKDLVSKLSETSRVAERVIVVPRPANDSLIALTAWERIEKLGKFDKGKIEGFIKSWHNRGPEKTAE